MDINNFDYDLPKEKIAIYPQPKRGESKLLVVDRKTGTLSHRRYSDIPEYIRRNDVVVLNNTKVVNSRLHFISSSGKVYEVLFLPSREGDLCEALINESKKLRIGKVLSLKENEKFKIELIKKDPTEPMWKLKWLSGEPQQVFEKYGHVPLPPYIEREDTEDDKARYNTTFASVDGSSASPTASLNLTGSILDEIRQKSGKVAEVTLHVGLGTFAPIRSDKIEEHNIHSEWYEIDNKNSEIINEAVKSGGRVWTFGTTVTRVIESSAEKGVILPFQGETDLYIYPGYDWKAVDLLVTNFHAPRTSLLTLVASFMGYNLMMKAYQEALENDYRFLSYGDSMLIL